MMFLDLAKQRFSVRAFADRAIEQEKLDSILEAAKYAPTAVNRQPQRIYVLKSEEALAKINSLCSCIYGAPVVLLVCYDETAAWKNPLDGNRDSGTVDAAIVCDEMMLTAWELGIGSCWVGYFNPAEVARVFDLPEHVKPVSLLPIGYAKEGCAPAAQHSQYRPMQEIVTEL